MTTIERGIETKNPILDDRRGRAVVLLDQYIAREQSPLRPDQMNVMLSLRNFFNNDNAAGYISLPPGYGKTAIFTQLTEALGMKTIVLSPTRKILSRTHESFGEFSPNVDVTNYFSDEKDLSGKVINTTYQSLNGLIERGELDPSEIDIVICDEVHTTLGEKRYTLFRNFPNALKIGLTATPFFNQLEGYRQRGIIKNDEQWLGVFENLIHEMSLEEAMEKGFLSKLDINLIKTGVDVGNVQIDSQGNYNEQDIRRYLDRKIRDNLVIAMVKGTDAVPKDISFDAEQMTQIAEVHEKIKGKKTVIFGLSVKHIEELSGLLRENGISAQAVHGGLSFVKQTEVFDSYEKGETQVILGVNLLTLGWDSPITEAGIFLAPTQSGIVAVQALGRILRTNPGKEEAIAIQMIDEYRLMHQSPILIPDLFDPYYVLRGTQEGKLKSPRNPENHRADRPPITISGYKVNALVDRAKSAEMLRKRFRNSSIENIATTIDSILAEIYNKKEVLSPYDLLKEITAAIPFHIPQEAGQLALQAIASLDSNKASLGKKAIIFLYAGSVLSAVDRFITDNKEENDDICQSAIEKVFETLNKNRKRMGSNIVYMAAERGASTYVAQKENMPIAWALSTKNYALIKSAISEITEERISLSEKELNEWTEKLSESTGISQKDLLDYVKYTLGLSITAEEIDETIYGNGFTFAANANTSNIMLNVLASLTPRERKILELRFGLNDSHETFTLDEIGLRLHVTRERIRQIEAKALRKMRHPTRSRWLRDLTSNNHQIWETE